MKVASPQKSAYDAYTAYTVYTAFTAYESTSAYAYNLHVVLCTSKI